MKATVRLRHPPGYGWNHGWWIACSVCGNCFYGLDTFSQARRARRAHQHAHRHNRMPLF